uniref:G_PROTEIN_RECEP_F1_2 domain-containing protein n=1 Tax=Bursaphelenchus xylophilus TaxID=6326 RepID=A0A1I7RZV3_BURXY
MIVVTYGWIGILPVQPIVRYYTVISQPCSKRDINQLFGYGISVVVLYGILVSGFIGMKNDIFDEVLRNQTLYILKDPVTYVVLDSTTANIFWPTIGGVLITLFSCSMVFVYIMKARKKMINMSEHMTEETRKIQKRMKNIVISQTAYPLLCLEVPAVLFCIYPWLEVEYASEISSIYSNILLHIFSILNPLSIIFFIPSNRRLVMDTIRCRATKRNSVTISHLNS